MKALLILLGAATGGAALMMSRRKARPLTFTQKAMRLGGRLMALSAIGCRAVMTEAESLTGTLKDAKKQSIKAWKAEPRLSFRLK